MLTDRQQAILDAFLEDPERARTSSELPDLGVDRTTLFRDLRKLVDDGLLVLEGKSYHVNRDSKEFLVWDLSRPPNERPLARYNIKLLDSYKPNRTTFLTDEQVRSLEAAGQAPAKSLARADRKAYERVLANLLIDLTYASSNLENVRISWLDTKVLLDLGQRPEGLSDQEMRIVMNHKAAISFIAEHAAEMTLSRKDLFDVHSLLTDGLISNRAAVGALRTAVVHFEDSRYLPPEVPQQIDEYFTVICKKTQGIKNPYEQAFFLMTMIPYLQPFQDGNKRTSRIAMNIPFVKGGLAPFSFTSISKRDYMLGLLAVYERSRVDVLADAFTAAYLKSAKRYTELIEHVSAGGLLQTVGDRQPVSEEPPRAKKRAKPR